MPLGKDCKSKWTQRYCCSTATCPSPTAHGIRFLSDWEIFDTSLNYAMKALKPMVHWCHPVIAYLWCHRQRCTQGSGSGSEDKFKRFILIIDAPMIPIGCLLLNNNKQIHFVQCTKLLRIEIGVIWVGNSGTYQTDWVDNNNNNSGTYLITLTRTATTKTQSTYQTYWVEKTIISVGLGSEILSLAQGRTDQHQR